MNCEWEGGSSEHILEKQNQEFNSDKGHLSGVTFPNLPHRACLEITFSLSFIFGHLVLGLLVSLPCNSHIIMMAKPLLLSQSSVFDFHSFFPLRANFEIRSHFCSDVMGIPTNKSCLPVGLYIKEHRP